jgi:hypothetical protein
MKDLTYKFEKKKKDNIKEWSAVRYLIENGFYYQHIYENGKALKYPKNIKDAKVFVEKFKEQKIYIFQIIDRINLYQDNNTLDTAIKILGELTFGMHLFQIMNEKEKFLNIIAYIKNIFERNNIRKDDLRKIKAYNEFAKRIKLYKVYRKEHEFLEAVLSGF